MITSDAVAGNELTDEGLTLQLVGPKVAAQLRLTVPAKPSWEAMEIGPLAPVLPAFTLGKGLGSPRTNEGFRATARVKDVVKGAGAAGVVASRVTV